MPSTTSTTLRAALRTGAVAALATAAVAVSAAGASAHVTVRPESTAAGGYAQLTFRVPTESDTASTSRLVVQLPTATPFTSVRTKPLPGWTASVTEGTLPAPVEVDGASITKAPLTVTWIASAGAQVGPGQYQDFQISVGPLPAEGTDVVLPATQTYSDGEVVQWAESIPESGEEPEHPAPAFAVTAAEEGGHGAHAAGGDAGGDAAEASAGSDTSDPLARWLAGGGLLVGLLGLAFGLTARRKAAA